jgi:hypothetical protein
VVGIPYKGSGPAVTDVLGGQVPMMFDSLASALPHIKGGKLKAIAMTTLRRVPQLPDVPTVAESGFPGFEGVGWGGLIVPAATPKDIIDKIAADSRKVLNDPANAAQKNFATAARVARELIERQAHHPLPQSTILNVNVPDLPYEQLRGFQATRLGFRHRAEKIVASQDGRGRPIYWIGPAGKGQDAGPGTDFHAVEHGYVSVTPLQIDLTRHTRSDSKHRIPSAKITQTTSVITTPRRKD